MSQLLWVPGASLGVDGGPWVAVHGFNIDGEASRPVFVARRLMDSRQPCLSTTFADTLIVVAAKVVFSAFTTGE